MNIAGAKRVFSQYGKSLRSDCDDIARLVQMSGLDCPLGNRNYLHALTLTDAMMRRTKHRFLMLTGGEGSGCLECLEEPFENMLTRIRAHQGTARVLIINGCGNSGSLKKLEEVFSGTLEVAEARTADSKGLPHFIVCDDRIAREEDLHEPINDESDANLIKAKVYFSNAAVCRSLADKFAIYWKHVKSQQIT